MCWSVYIEEACVFVFSIRRGGTSDLDAAWEHLADPRIWGGNDMCVCVCVCVCVCECECSNPRTVSKQAPTLLLKCLRVTSSPDIFLWRSSVYGHESVSSFSQELKYRLVYVCFWTSQTAKFNSKLLISPHIAYRKYTFLPMHMSV